MCRYYIRSTRTCWSWISQQKYFEILIDMESHPMRWEGFQLCRCEPEAIS